MPNDNIFAGYQDHYRAELRLVILRAINDDPGKSVSDSRLHLLIKDFGFKITREYLQTELLWLQDQGRAVRLRTAGSVVIAELIQAGADHLDRTSPIVGVQMPSLPR